MKEVEGEKLVYNIKLSSVGPGRVTGSGVTHEPNGIDIAMKLHYVVGVYLYGAEEAKGLSVTHMKEAMFSWCSEYYVICGRYWRFEPDGRPYLKCNDCGVRFIEAECDKSIEEWVAMKDFLGLNKLLVYHTPIGPHLSFSPQLLVQVTRFKCGGVSMGLSWAHILGDPFSASDCFNSLSQLLLSCSNPNRTPSFHFTKPNKQPDIPLPEIQMPLSLKRVDPVGDHWVTPNKSKMATFSFHISSTHLTHIETKIWGQSPKHQISSFESLCAIIWQSIANVTTQCEPNVVTICKKDPYRKTCQLSNTQSIYTVKADFPIVHANLRELAMILVDHVMDEENTLIEDIAEKDNAVCDYIVYGANLTFLDLEEADLYGLQVDGLVLKPEFVHYSVEGVGDAGIMVVQIGPETKDGDRGRIVTLILVESDMSKIKLELVKNGLLLE